VEWFRLAAAQGNAEVLFNLAVSHSNGEGVPQDYDAALRLFKRAAALGYAEAAAEVDELQAQLGARSGRRA